MEDMHGKTSECPERGEGYGDDRDSTYYSEVDAEIEAVRRMRAFRVNNRTNNMAVVDRDRDDTRDKSEASTIDERSSDVDTEILRARRQTILKEKQKVAEQRRFLQSEIERDDAMMDVADIVGEMEREIYQTHNDERRDTERQISSQNRLNERLFMMASSVGDSGERQNERQAKRNSVRRQRNKIKKRSSSNENPVYSKNSIVEKQMCDIERQITLQNRPSDRLFMAALQNERQRSKKQISDGGGQIYSHSSNTEEQDHSNSDIERQPVSQNSPSGRHLPPNDSALGRTKLLCGMERQFPLKISDSQPSTQNGQAHSDAWKQSDFEMSKPETAVWERKRTRGRRKKGTLLVDRWLSNGTLKRHLNLLPEDADILQLARVFERKVKKLSGAKFYLECLGPEAKKKMFQKQRVAANRNRVLFDEMLKDHSNSSLSPESWKKLDDLKKKVLENLLNNVNNKISQAYLTLERMDKMKKTGSGAVPNLSRSRQ